MAPIGVTVPKLLPIAGTWAAPFALYNIILSTRITTTRIKTEHYAGDTLPSSKADPSSTGPDALQVASRCHVNFLENVPLAFIFLIIAELNGGNRKTLNYLMGTLFALRIAHAEFGLRLEGKFGDNGVGRPLGYFGSIGVIGALGGYCASLITAYWGY